MNLIRSDSFTNLFAGIFTGNLIILFGIVYGKIHSISYTFITCAVLYLVFLLHGFFVLFRFYHRENLHMKSTEHDVDFFGKDHAIIALHGTTFTIITVFSILPFVLSESITLFYTLFTFVIILDLVWLNLYMNKFTSGRDTFPDIERFKTADILFLSVMALLAVISIINDFANAGWVDIDTASFVFPTLNIMYVCFFLIYLCYER